MVGLKTRLQTIRAHLADARMQHRLIRVNRQRHLHPRQLSGQLQRRRKSGQLTGASDHAIHPHCLGPLHQLRGAKRPEAAAAPGPSVGEIGKWVWLSITACGRRAIFSSAGQSLGLRLDTLFSLIDEGDPRFNRWGQPRFNRWGQSPVKGASYMRVPSALPVTASDEGTVSF